MLYAFDRLSVLLVFTRRKKTGSQPTDGRTDKQYYRVASILKLNSFTNVPQLKMGRTLSLARHKPQDWVDLTQILRGGHLLWG